MKALKTLLISSMIVAAAGVAHGQMGFSAAGAGIELSDADRGLLEQSIRSVLEAGEVGTVDSWQNPETGISGQSTLLEAYTEGDTSCARVDFQIKRRDRVAPFDIRFCQRPDGTWGIAG